MRYPLHRSLVLWGALLVMGFTVWAWVDSRGMNSGVMWRGMAAENIQNGISIGWRSRSTSFWAGREEGHVLPEQVLLPPFFLCGKGLKNSDLPENESSPETLKELAIRWMRTKPPDDWILFIPHWLVLLVEAAAGGGLIAWRARRWRSWHRLQEAGSTTEAVE